MIDLSLLIEDCNEEFAMAAGCQLEGGRCIVNYLYHIQDPDTGLSEIQDVMETILGTTAVPNAGDGPGMLDRSPPLRCAQFPWMYASAISSIRGLGKWTQVDAVTVPGEPDWPFLPAAAIYDLYRFTVEFTDRPYAILTNDQIGLLTGTAYDVNGNSYSYNYAQEWLRWTDFTDSPLADTVTAQTGTMKFSCTGDANNQKFSAMPYMPLNTSQMTIHWRAVPLRYITSPNSYLENYRGRLNQNQLWFWDAGQLLYLNYTPRIYNPPVPQLGQVYPAGNSASSWEKLVDIDMHFVLATRFQDNEESIVLGTHGGNVIPDHHNLLPWLADRQFHFAMTDPSASAFPNTTNAPAFYSFPMELLFFDPDIQEIPSTA